MARAHHNSDEEEALLAAELAAVALQESGVEYDDFIAIARAEEGQKVQASKRDAVRGKSMPKLKYMRDARKDKQPLTPEQLGLNEEDAFLTSRELDIEDLQKHQQVHKKGFLGSNFRNPADFMRMFDKGLSTKQQPKLDLKSNIENNPLVKKILIAQQILTNLKSEDRTERVMMEKLLKDLHLEDELMEDLLQKEHTEAEKEKLIQRLKERIPNSAI